MVRWIHHPSETHKRIPQTQKTRQVSGGSGHRSFGYDPKKEKEKEKKGQKTKLTDVIVQNRCNIL